jgi:AraC family transcriptional regulator
MRETTLRFYKERLLTVLVHIQQHLDDPLRLEQLAALSCLSPHHFHHVFTGMMGESVASHVRRLRLERSASRLKHTRLSVTEIAFEAGYETHEAFTRAFRQAFNASPAAYRRINTPPLEIDAPSAVHFKDAGRVTRFRAAGSGDKTMCVTIKTLEPQRVAFIRHVGPYADVKVAWDRLTMLLGKEGLLGGDSRFIGICHDDPAVTDAQKIRYDACVTVGKAFRPFDDLGVQTVAGGDYAVLTHIGPFDRLGESYAKLLGQWLPRSGRRLRAMPCFEVYFNSPDETDPEDLVTDIHAPLEGR